MKKILVLLLVAVLCVSLIGCGASKEDMIKQAETIDSMDLRNISQEASDNIARAKENYDGKYYLVEDLLVSNIGSKYFESLIARKYGPNLHVRVNLPKEDIINLDKGDHVTVVGKLKISRDYSFDITNAQLVG